MEYLASSIPYFTYYGNPQYTEKPYIEITVKSGSTLQDGEWLKVEDVEGSNYSLTITGEYDGGVTTTSFNSSDTSVNDPILSLAEAMKKNISLFYDVKTWKDSSGNTHVKAYYDNSTNYVTTASSNLSLSGNYDGKYVPMVHYTMHYIVNDGDSEFDAEKYTNEQRIRFTLNSPFSNTLTKYPVKFKYDLKMSYDTASGSTNTKQLLDYGGEYSVLPTTCGEFYDLNYSLYNINTSVYNKKKFLTTRQNREITYDERIALSILSNNPKALDLTLMYFTPSGILITTRTISSFADDNWFDETVNGRTDIYVDPMISEVEKNYGKTVGYIEAFVKNGSHEATERMRLTVNGRCNSVNTIYFINKIGGVDWYTFRGSNTIESDIDDNETYSSLFSGTVVDGVPTATYHKTNVRYKTMEKKKTLNTGKISHSEAKWLDELASTKYAFIYHNGMFYEIVIDETDIEIDSSERYVEASVSYYMGDKDLI